MRDPEIINFETAMRNSDPKPALLLGNGFSISLASKFYYENLFAVAKDTMDRRLIEIFTKLDTYDFEKVLDSLEIGKTITNFYDQNTSEEIALDLDRLRCIFLSSLQKTHPYNLEDLDFDEPKIRHIVNFISKFSAIFTTNYDLLLYWIVMEGRRLELTKFKDGFGKDQNNNLIWQNNRPNIFYLHGALHLYQTNDYPFVRKLQKDAKNNLHRLLKANIEQGKYPLVVFEGKSDRKIEQILSNPYLNFCYDQLKKVSGSIFILGSSLNIDTDEHIVSSLKSNDNCEIFVGIYDQKDAVEYRKKFFPKEVTLFSSRSVFEW